jgi:hypothetical protein
MAINPKSLTPSIVSWVQNKNSVITYTFALSLFLFFSFFFSKLSRWSSYAQHHHHHDPSLGSTTWHETYHFMSTHLAQWLVLRFHQLSKTKLGLLPPLVEETACPRSSTQRMRLRSSAWWSTTLRRSEGVQGLISCWSHISCTYRHARRPRAAACSRTTANTWRVSIYLPCQLRRNVYRLLDLLQLLALGLDLLGTYYGDSGGR